MVIETSEATPERDRSPKCVHIDFSLEVDAWMHIADGGVNIASGIHFRIIYFWTPPPSGRRRWYTGSWCLTARRTCCASEQPSWSWRGTLCTRPCRFTLPPVSAHLEHWFLRKDINSALYLYITETFQRGAPAGFAGHLQIRRLNLSTGLLDSSLSRTLEGCCWRSDSCWLMKTTKAVSLPPKIV